MVELIELLDEMIGKNNDGASKSAVSVDEKTIDASGSTKFGREYAFATPSVNIISNGNFLIVDLTFPPEGAAELRTAWNCLENFGTKANKNLDGAELDIVEFVIIPLKYNGQYFCTLVNPLFWARQSSAFGKPIDSIRMLFEKDAVNFYEGLPADEQAINKEIEAELYEEQKAEEDAKIRQAERDEYIERANARRNSMNK